jgi:hypothetical protein
MPAEVRQEGDASTDAKLPTATNVIRDPSRRELEQRLSETCPN